jgi:hypothetical protein
MLLFCFIFENFSPENVSGIPKHPILFNRNHVLGKLFMRFTKPYVESNQMSRSSHKNKKFNLVFYL